ncbi:MAG: glycosyltransferase family 2 protein [Bacteroidota bacterium]|nr:glycosyltransferase family 2 protein [Bacteroidota bacterium]
MLSTYNGGEFLAEQLDSILTQTYTNLEIIITDDASTDNTVEIIKQYQQKDSRIKFFENSQNKGPNKNFEKGIQHASGEYISISDQDDIWDSRKIETMMKLWPPGSLFIFSIPGQFHGRDFESRKPIPRYFFSAINNVHKLVFNTPVSGHACMFKKELVACCLPFPEDIYYDWWISIHAASMGTLGCIPETLSWQRIHGNNFSLKVYSTGNKKEKQAALRKQWIYFIETFFKKSLGGEKEKKSLLKYAGMLKKMNGTTFSLAMFRYILKNRKLVFHYKRKPFVFISHLKHAYRMARSGVI